MASARFRKLALTGTAAVSAIILSGCGLTSGNAAGEDKTITMIVTESAPYQEPTEIARELLEEKGWTLEPTYVTDIVQPNLAVANGEYDANFFQHLAYMDQFNKDKDLDIVGAFYVYSGPGGIWSEEYDSLDELPDGATIGIPVDTANNGRALHLLRNAGLLELSNDSVISTSQEDITGNPKNLEFVEVDQQSLTQTLPDVDAGFLIARMAADIGLTQNDALAFEAETDQAPFRILVGVRPDFLDSEKAKVLQEAYQSPEVKEWFENYQGGILPTPWDESPSDDLSKL